MNHHTACRPIFHARLAATSKSVGILEIEASSAPPAPGIARRLAAYSPPASAARLITTAVTKPTKDGFSGACADFGGGIDELPATLLTDGALRRVTGLALAGEGGAGGDIVPLTRGAVLLDTEADFSRRDRGTMMYMCMR